MAWGSERQGTGYSGECSQLMALSTWAQNLVDVNTSIQEMKLQLEVQGDCSFQRQLWIAFGKPFSLSPHLFRFFFFFCQSWGLNPELPLLHARQSILILSCNLVFKIKGPLSSLLRIWEGSLFPWPQGDSGLPCSSQIASLCVLWLQITGPGVKNSEPHSLYF